MNRSEYYNLDVWVESRLLSVKIYNLTKNFPKEEQFGLTSQIRRCSISVPSNIAEGCGRNTSKDTIRFLYIARDSLYELETQLFLSSDLGFIKKSELDDVLEYVVVCKKLINGFIKYYNKLALISSN